uniref:Hexon-associated protein IX n=1 Tax=Pipistrellus pipistrellus adenovirus TaxID=3140007 RepID=A0AAU6S533_9ADEN
MAANQESQGHINTSFLTTKLPTWAGVRQNIIGSDLNGRPVPAFLPPHEVQAAAETWGRARGPVMEHTTAIAEAIEDLKIQVTRSLQRAAALEMRLARVEARPAELNNASLMEMESALGALNVRTANISRKLGGVEERLRLLEEAVEEMEEDDETQLEPPAAPPAENNEASTSVEQ